jgi:hypothetical protein
MLLLPANFFKELLVRKPFQKRLERKLLLNLKRHDGVINRRNGCGPAVTLKRG